MSLSVSTDEPAKQPKDRPAKQPTKQPAKRPAARQTDRPRSDKAAAEEAMIRKAFYGIMIPPKEAHSPPRQSNSRDFLHDALKMIMRTFKVIFRNVGVERDILQG